MNKRVIKELEIDTADDRNQCLDALADMLNQFAYRIERKGKLTLCSGGLSSLELAFDVLGLPDPVLLSEYWDLIEERRCKSWADVKAGWKKR